MLWYVVLCMHGWLFLSYERIDVWHLELQYKTFYDLAVAYI